MSGGGYAEACAWHATNQGLDPIVAALRAANVPVVVEQTGGFCMVATVYLNEDHTRWIAVVSDETGFTACVFEGDEEGIPLIDGGVSLAENATIAATVRAVNKAWRECAK